MRILKKVLIWIAVIFVVLIGGIFIGGAMLPAEHAASRTLQSKQSSQAIWDTINDHANEQQWRSELTNVTSLGERNGKPVWQENYKSGNKLALITTESKPPTRLVRELTDLDGPFSGRWEIDIQPTQTGSTVKITEIGRVGNPFFRFLSKYVIGHTTQMEKYLTNLATKFGEKAEIVE
jgi:hypothetical protein